MLSIAEIIEVTHAVLFPLLGDVEKLAERSIIKQHLMRASVSIQGTTYALVLVECSEVLARRLGGAMFDADPSTLSHDEVTDALGEIANIIGGNIKALLPGPSRLGLPVIELNVLMPPDDSILEQGFQCTGEPLHVCLASNDTSLNLPFHI